MKNTRISNRIKTALMTALVALAMTPVAAFGLNVNYHGDYKQPIGRYTVTQEADEATGVDGYLSLTRLTTYGKTLDKVYIGPKTIGYGDNAGTYYVTVIRPTAFKNSVATDITLPKTITKIRGGAFRGSKATNLTVRIRSTKLTKGRVKGMFLGSGATKITVKVPKSKLKYYKKTVFTKANTGAPGTIEVIA